jgi:hypothetical protein
MELYDVGDGCQLRLEVLSETSSPDGEHKVVSCCTTQHRTCCSVLQDPKP